MTPDNEFNGQRDSPSAEHQANARHLEGEGRAVGDHRQSEWPVGEGGQGKREEKREEREVKEKRGRKRLRLRLEVW